MVPTVARVSPGFRVKLEALMVPAELVVANTVKLTWIGAAPSRTDTVDGAVGLTRVSTTGEVEGLTSSRRVASLPTRPRLSTAFTRSV